MVVRLGAWNHEATCRVVVRQRPTFKGRAAHDFVAELPTLTPCYEDN